MLLGLVTKKDSEWGRGRTCVAAAPPTAADSIQHFGDNDYQEIERIREMLNQYEDVIMIARKANADGLTNLAKLRENRIGTEQEFHARVYQKKALLE